MEFQNYEDVPVILPKSNGKAMILSDRSYHTIYGDYVTLEIKELLSKGINTVDLPNYMDLFYLCDGEEIIINLRYDGNFSFSVITITGNSKIISDDDMKICGFHLYGLVGDYLLKKLGYIDINDNSIDIDTEVDVNTIIGPH